MARIKWEYQITDIEFKSNTGTAVMLDKFGLEGWELISILPIVFNRETVRVNYVFKRVL